MGNNSTVFLNLPYDVDLFNQPYPGTNVRPNKIEIYLLSTTGARFLSDTIIPGANGKFPDSFLTVLVPNTKIAAVLYVPGVGSGSITSNSIEVDGTSFALQITTNGGLAFSSLSQEPIANNTVTVTVDPSVQTADISSVTLFFSTFPPQAPSQTVNVPAPIPNTITTMINTPQASTLLNILVKYAAVPPIQTNTLQIAKGNFNLFSQVPLGQVNRVPVLTEGEITQIPPIVPVVPIAPVTTVTVINTNCCEEKKNRCERKKHRGCHSDRG